MCPCIPEYNMLQVSNTGNSLHFTSSSGSLVVALSGPQLRVTVLSCYPLCSPFLFFLLFLNRGPAVSLSPILEPVLYFLCSTVS